MGNFHPVVKLSVAVLAEVPLKRVLNFLPCYHVNVIALTSELTMIVES